MPQSLSNALIHLVFSTKHRHPYLRDPGLREVMTSYLIGTLRNLNCPSLCVGVVEDHVHILCQLHRTISIATLVEKIKSSSSSRIKEESNPAVKEFHWQAGYGVFTVSQSNAKQVIEYIENQDEHHRQRTFQDELRILLQKHEIEWDEKYVWD